MERRIDVAARAQFLGVLSGDRRTVRAIVDFREQLDRLLVRAVARGVRAERVVSGAHHAERVRALDAVHRERLLRLLGEFEGVLGAAVGECDAREDDLRGRLDALVAGHLRERERALCELLRIGRGTALEVDRREGVQDRELERAILDPFEELKRTPIVLDGGVELAGVVERDGHAHVSLRGHAQLI